MRGIWLELEVARVSNDIFSYLIFDDQHHINTVQIISLQQNKTNIHIQTGFEPEERRSRT